MGVLRAGILGNIRGKVAGVVGSQWKDKNYLREYIKPANPNTVSQQTQRTKMSDVVSFCKPLVGSVFNVYTDRFQKSMSGFNHFVKENISIFDGDPDYTAILLTDGKLNPIIASSAVYTTGTGALVITFDKNLGNNGNDTDKIYSAAYDSDTGLWYFPAAEVLRSTETITITCDTGLTSTSIHTYTWAAAYTSAIVQMISNSDYCVGEDA